MSTTKTIQGVLKHFQSVDISSSRAQELYDELSLVNTPVKAAYENLADFNAQPADYLSLLVALRREALDHEK